MQSRRRCCVCFGLHRDDGVKKGQIGHLDGDPNNNEPDNLAWLCFDHHDEYDSRTSQSKGLTRAELQSYRTELIDHFGRWQMPQARDEMLNFLTFTIDLNMMADAAVRAGGQVVFYGESLAFEVLIQDAFDSCDADLYVPYLHCLDCFAAWGWLTYTYEERHVSHDEMERVFIEVKRKPVCDQVATRILDRRRERGEDVDRLVHAMSYVGWKEPADKWRS